MINVVWLQTKDGLPARGYWDMTLLEQLLDDTRFTHHEVFGTPTLLNLDGAIVVLPAAGQASNWLNVCTVIGALKWCLLIVTSDEENQFPVDNLPIHPNLVIWSQTPNKDPAKRFKQVSKWLPIGPTPGFMKALANTYRPSKTRDWFYGGQTNCDSRLECLSVISKLPNGLALPSEGFAQGIPVGEYATYMAESKVIPAPGGHVSPDSFRLAEALEAGSIPVTDYPEFWKAIFGTPQFSSVTDTTWTELPEIINYSKYYWDLFANGTTSWWINYKHNLKTELLQTLNELGADNVDYDIDNTISVIVTSSPIPSHPSTAILEETIESIRYHLPTATIFVCFDGIRNEQRNLQDQYNEYQANAMWLMNHKWKNVVPVRSLSHRHQVGMTLLALEQVTTPLLLFVEADTPLTHDSIDWQSCTQAIKVGFANLIRFSHEANILPAHEHLMLDSKPMSFLGARLRRTRQWSQRPHLASVPYYKQILAQHFSDDAKCFIEDRMYGVVENGFLADGEMNWNLHKLYIYEPDGDIKRSYHTDGRAGGSKYDDTQIW